MLELFIRRLRPKWTLRCIAGLGGAGRERSCCGHGRFWRWPHRRGLGGGHFGGFWRPVHGLERRGATATVARELESEIHGLLFFETLC